MGYLELASSEDYEAWMNARRGGVTATDISRLATSLSEWDVIRREKRGEVAFKGSKATRWGHEREPIIASRMSEKYSELEHNTHTICTDWEPRFLATPDMIGATKLCQIKTAALKPNEPVWWEPSLKYKIQCQWEMFVAERDENILAAEFHHNYKPLQNIFEYVIKRDDELLKDLTRIAYLFLDGGSWELDQKLNELAKLRADFNAAKEKMTEAEGMILKEVGDHTLFAYESSAGSIKWSPVKPRETFDRELWERDHPESGGTYVKLTPQKPRLTINTKDENESQ